MANGKTMKLSDVVAQKALAEAQKRAEQPKTTPVVKGDEGAVVKTPKPPKDVADTIDPNTLNIPAFQPGKRRHTGLWVSFLLMVILPGILATWYWMDMASDRYTSVAGFSIRTADGVGEADPLGGLTGLTGATSTAGDSMMVVEFLRSRDLVDTLLNDVDLFAIYNHPDIDPLFRLNEDATLEDLIKHWHGRIHITHDNMSGLITFEVEAFTPQDAHTIGTLVLNAVENLVNEVSEAARRENLANAREEVRIAEERLRTVTEELERFRAMERALNPLGAAEARVAQIAQLELELSTTQRELQERRSRGIAESSRIVQDLRRMEQALQGQLQSLRSETNVSADQIARFERLELEKVFAQQTYASAMTHMEQTRATAAGRERFLAVFQRPREPQSAVYPRREINTALSWFALLAFWGIASIVTSNVRDKMI